MKATQGTQLLVTGKMLVAEPFMLDPNFKRTVVLVADYTREEGTVGFILNKPLEVRLPELTSDFGDFEVPVHYGGPVDNDSMYFIHDAGDLLEGSIQISRGVYWSGNYEKLRFLVEHKLILPHNIRFYIGYSGWSKGQLESEMMTQSWIVSELEPNFVFKSNPRMLWKEILEYKGMHYSALSKLEGDELMN
ncbi:MAG: YqgE/AlgH family protein [Saprospiraceae bacterium]|nr:YqgE/AlgH family protein [Saprospiraceae bacterium]MBP9209641.1 YqgE/AlgH family protein [Saprospiraceae bacterium]